jgi:hypothetical protein
MQYDANDEQMSLEIVEVWHRLMENKVIRARRVLRRVSKDELSAEQLKDPNIASSIKKFGYYDFDPYPLSENTLKVLDFFVKLGYVNKSLDNIHKISYHHEVHPYEPYILPSGVIGIIGKGKATTKIIDLDSKRYSNFVKTARDFNNQWISGKQCPSYPITSSPEL